MNESAIRDLLSTCDLLLTDPALTLTPAGRHRSASFALRTALELAIDDRLKSSLPGLGRIPMRARLLCLRSFTDPRTARRARSVWSHLCLGCHYHQYEMGPSADQVRSWRAEVAGLVEALQPR